MTPKPENPCQKTYTVNVRKRNVRFDKRTFGLTNQTHLCLVIDHWVCFYFCLVTRLDRFILKKLYNTVKTSDRKPNEPNKNVFGFRNRMNFTTEPKLKALKSERSDFGHLL